MADAHGGHEGNRGSGCCSSEVSVAQTNTAQVLSVSRSGWYTACLVLTLQRMRLGGVYKLCKVKELKVTQLLSEV